MKKVIVLLLLLVASPLCAEVIDNGDSTVTDTETGLMWRKYESSESYTIVSFQYYLDNLNYGKYSNWRLPTINELSEIIRHAKYPNIGSLSSETQDGIMRCYGCWMETDTAQSWGASLCMSGKIIAVRVIQINDVIYSRGQMDAVVQSAILQERARWDVRGDNKIGMEEAIRALQIISGIRIQ